MERIFRFKQFSLSDHGAAMKIGTDAVLLGSLAATQSAGTVLDVGTGSGIIALMVAQKTGTQIDAIEPDKEAALQAQRNFSCSPWPEKLSLFRSTLQEFVPENNLQYDLIICNPPYFQNSLRNAHESKAMARHNVGLLPEEMFLHVARLLSPKGSFMMIYPAGKESELDLSAKQRGLLLKERWMIHPMPGKPVKRIVQTYVRDASTPPAPLIHSFCIETLNRHEFSSEYKNLTADYHPFL